MTVDVYSGLLREGPPIAQRGLYVVEPGDHPEVVALVMVEGKPSRSAL